MGDQVDTPDARVGEQEPAEQVQPKRARGRPTTYKPEYAQSLLDYMDMHGKYTRRVTETHTNTRGQTWTTSKREPRPLRFISAWCRREDLATSTIKQWVGEHADFAAAYHRAREIQSEHLLDCGFQRLSDPIMTRFAAFNLTDLIDKTAEGGMVAQPTIVIQVTAPPVRQRLESHEVTPLPVVPQIEGEIVKPQ